MKRESLIQRPRRLRKTIAIREMVCETHLRAEQLVWPVFVQEGDTDTPIAVMPGCERFCISRLRVEARRAWDLGIRAMALFPSVANELKCERGLESANPNGLIPRAVDAIKSVAPEMLVITDVALDPYNCDGHDGVVSPQGVIENDESVALLCNQAVMQAGAGADIVAPSDMMDGRIAAIRYALDQAGYQDTAIMSYAIKYASAFYGPFRGALDSAPRQSAEKSIPADKKTYQMDPANVREGMREALLDEQQGADMLMVKPAGAYLDVVSRLRGQTNLPIVAYQVSGEYAMLHAASQQGWLDLRACVLESLLGIRRAGADMIFTYFAPEAAEWLA